MDGVTAVVGVFALALTGASLLGLLLAYRAIHRNQ